MNTITCMVRKAAGVAALVGVIAATTSCGIEKQTAPALAGPSEFGQSITLTASPDQLARDGESQSVITVAALDAASKPIPGLAVTMFANAGFLSEQQVVTGSNGRATLVYTAPSLQEVVNTAVISGVPVGSNIDNAAARNVAIGLIAPSEGVPSFTVSPGNPARFGLAVFDASATRLNGAPCASACTYEWTFGGEGTATGQIASHRFQHEGAYTVVLTVTSPGGVITHAQRSVTVGAPTLPTPSFVASPTDPQPQQEVFFNASASTAANGATIVEYIWDFGDGTSTTGVTTHRHFTAEGSYQVLLTVVDSNGLRSSVAKAVSVVFRDGN